MTHDTLHTVDCATFLGNEEAQWKLLRALSDDVSQVAETIGPICNTVYGKTWLVKAVPDPENLAYSSLPLPPHQDLLYYESPPGLQLLHCITFDEMEGGETFFIDGFNAADILRKNNPEAFKTLTKVPMTFSNFRTEYKLKYRRHIIQLDDLENVTGVNISPPWEGALVADSEDVGKFYESYREFMKILEDPQNRYMRKLKPGELVVFNNRRLLHGREGFGADAGHREFEGAYVSLDDFSNRFHNLKEIFDDKDEAVLKRLGNNSVF